MMLLLRSSLPLLPVFGAWSLCFALVLPALRADIDHGQGEMVGEVTAHSAILQSRLTEGSSLIDGDLPGHAGEARFEISDQESFTHSAFTDWITASPDQDFIVKARINGLLPGHPYFYRLQFAEKDRATAKTGPTRRFRTWAPGSIEPVHFVVTSCMNYAAFHGLTKGSGPPYTGADRSLGYPALEAILKLKPQAFVGTGDIVYYDQPAKTAAKTQPELRRKWHEQFVQPRFPKLFAEVHTYWEKDDHDWRRNDSDPSGPYEPLVDLGLATFREQTPVVLPGEADQKTYRTHRLSRDLQIWLVEGRDYRSPNNSPDGQEKTLWGQEQMKWLKETLLASDATFKILISPTPLVGPDDAYKKDNHTNIGGFRHEGLAFKEWIREAGLTDRFFIMNGDRHWQYHSIDPTGIHEFSCGTLDNSNARKGRIPGDPKSTDPQSTITQPYGQGKADQVTGGFIEVVVSRPPNAGKPEIAFQFYDDTGLLGYRKSFTTH
ncbi:MAG: alkaline phosphatase D family protein [Verrucomicrobiales bacterium]|nr:alkaline phosphatase D family protein [Verrucomicrobiales bacterium]